MTSIEAGKLMKDRNSNINAFKPQRKAEATMEDRGPPTDIISTPEEYVYCIDVPGFTKSNIQVVLGAENMLVIKNSGKRKRENDIEEDMDDVCDYQYLKLERSKSERIMRMFKLPQDANASEISTNCENGVLTITVRKNPLIESKNVEISVP